MNNLFATNQEAFAVDKSQLVLSVFSGVDLFRKGFEDLGFCVVSASDLDFGFDIRNFTPICGKFDGIIGGSPCQDFSMLNRNRNLTDGYGVQMLREFERIVATAKPKWFVLENVPQVPDIGVDGYFVQRVNLNAKNYGSKQNRNRRFQFGSFDNRVLKLPPKCDITRNAERCVVASESNKKNRRTFADVCELQGLPRGYDLPRFTKKAKYRAVGNGVPLALGRAVAFGVVNSIPVDLRQVALCGCGCGEFLKGRQTYFSKNCSKRAERNRKSDRA